jgi:hypothetical protein
MILFYEREGWMQMESNVASAIWGMPPDLHASFSCITLPLAEALGSSNLDPYEGAAHSRIR